MLWLHTCSPLSTTMHIHAFILERPAETGFNLAVCVIKTERNIQYVRVHVCVYSCGPL